MNRSKEEGENEEKIDAEIMKALLIAPQQSIYYIQKTLKKTVKESNYATVWRHVKKLKKQELVIIAQDKLRKDGTLDKRNPKKAGISPKGLAWLLIEENLQKEELRLIGLKLLQENFGTVPPEFWSIMPLEDIFSDALIKIKPKVNLRFFDEKYFIEIFIATFLESIIDYASRVKIEGKESTFLMGLDALREKMAKKGFSKEFEDSIEWGKMLGSTLKQKEE